MADWSDILDIHADALGRVLADASREFVCLATAHGELFYVNSAGRKLLGFPDEQDVSVASLRKCYGEASWAELREVAMPAVNKHGRWEGRSRLRHAVSGEWIDVQTQMLRVKAADAGATYLAIIHHEAGDAGLKAALTETRARKNAILESALDAIITINSEGIITEFNRAAERLFGRDREKVLGARPSDALFPPNTSPDQQNRIDRYLAQGEGSLLGRRSEVTAMRANGEMFPAEIAMTISHEQGEPVMTFFVRDISRRKKAEAEQARYAAELERSNRELEQFAYAASHDLQEPLRKIIAFGQRLQLQCAGQIDDAGVDCLQRIQSAAERMQSLIDGLLRLSRVTTQGQKFVSVDLVQIAREVVSDLEVKIEQVHGRVELNPLPTLVADPLQMRQLLQNLIANGLKFHRDDVPPVVRIAGGCVPDHEHGKIPLPGEESLTGARKFCRIVVGDNGIGIEEKYQERIFGLFQRLHPRDVFEGTGIGLALCRKIVERHGGQITAHSMPGKGTVFEVLLPLVQES